MSEKIMIIDTGFTGTKITTVDGTKRNLVKNFDVEEHSFYELAKRVYKRFEDEKYDRVIVDAYGAGMGLLDSLIPLFEKNNYAYDSKSGKVSKIERGIVLNSGEVALSGVTLWAKGIQEILDSSKEEF